MVAMDLHPAPLHRQTPEHHGADQPTPAALVAGQVAAVVESILPEISRSGTLTPAGGTPVPFDIARDIRFLPKERLPYHVNALTIRAWGGSPSSGSVESGAPSSLLLERTYYSVGGGFVMVQTTEDPQEPRVESLATPGTAGTLDVSAPTPSRPRRNCSPAATQAGCRSRTSCAPTRSPCAVPTWWRDTWIWSPTRCSPARMRAARS